MDIAILVDTSKSMKKNQTDKLTKLIGRLIDKYPVSAKGNHYAFITFDHEAIIHNKFENQGRYKEKDLKNLLEIKIRRSSRWGTRSDIALYLAAKELFTKKGADRADAKNILLVFTDGLQHIARKDKKPFKDFSKSTKILEVSHFFLITIKTRNMPSDLYNPLNNL